MEIRKATLNELEQMLEIYSDARRYMRENGNAEQ